MNYRPANIDAGESTELGIDKNSVLSGNYGFSVMDIDTWRSFVFPNNIRELRKSRGLGSLLQLSERLPKLTYIRLSKIERGEVFARAKELKEIAQALDVDPEDLLLDIDDAGFDIAEWASRIVGPEPVNPKSDQMAVLIAAAVRARRAADPALTIATIENEYGIAPVILSRIENAQKPYERWNDDVRTGVRRLLGTADDAETYLLVGKDHADGKLDALLPQIANPAIRIEKSRDRIAALRRDLSAVSHANDDDKASRARQIGLVLASDENGPVPILSEPEPRVHEPASARIVPVFGAALPEGLIARHPTGAFVEAPRSAGPRAYGLRLCRPTLGPALPGRATLIVDPDRFPTSGGLGVIESEDGSLRAVSVTVDRQGRTIGFSQMPDFETVIDDLAPNRVASVIAAIFE